MKVRIWSGDNCIQCALLVKKISPDDAIMSYFLLGCCEWCLLWDRLPFADYMHILR